jgi:arabinan endo-1,5-alpha-L-arabinosidase
MKRQSVKTGLFLTCLGLVLSFSALIGPGAQTATGSVWTLSGDLNSHDPCIVKEGNTWWIGRTWAAGIGIAWSSDGHAWNSGVPIFSSGLSWWHQYNGNTAWIWAPSIVNYNGHALCYYAVSTFGSKNSAIGLATATTIATGNWTDQGAILTSNSGTSYNAIDPCFATDSSNNPWLSFGSWSQGIYLTRLSTSTFKPTGSFFHIANNSAGIENSQIVRNGSFYYLFCSVGTCCDGASSTYHIVYGRSSSITGPYLDKNGANMLNGGGTTLDAGGSRFKAPGGQSAFNNGGNWVLARHELDSQNNYATVLFINDLFWVNGWPSY